MPTTAIPFGHYFLLERLAVGGMAEVYLAKSADAAAGDKLVAVKRILPNIAEDQEFVAMFIDEAKIAGQLNHGNIARIYDLGKIHSSYFIAMEYVPGPDLRSIWDQSRDDDGLNLAMICYVVQKLCDGLDYAHRRHDSRGRPLNIIHRDVSPQNVLISYDGDVKIIDFGIAKAANRAVKTQTGILKGKFAYMAPEQARGEVVDHRVDLFAAGVILYELCTGERLYKADSDFALLDKVRKVDITLPSELNPALVGDMERIILRALAPRVEERYGWASALSADLQRYMDDHGLSFSREQLAEYAREIFFEDYRLELERLNEYQQLDAVSLSNPEGQPHRADAAENPFPPVRETTPVEEATQVNPSPFDEEPPSEAETVLDDQMHEIAASFKLPRDEPDEETREDEAVAERTLTRDRPPPVPPEEPDSLDSGLYEQTEDGQADEDGEDDETSVLPPYSEVSLGPEPPTFLDPELFTSGEHHQPGDAITFPSGLHAVQDEARRPLVSADEGGLRPADESGLRPAEDSDGFSSQGFEQRRVEGVRRSSELDFVPSRWPLAVAFLVGIVTTMIVVLIVALVGLGGVGHLVVITAPRETEVEIDGQRLGARTPLQLSLEPGEHDVILRRPGIPPVERAITVSKDQVLLLDEVMPRGKASLKIKSDPDEAAVVVNGEPAGSTPLDLSDLPADEPIKIELSHKLTRPWSEQLTLEAGEARELAPILAHKFSRVTVTPSPEDAVVFWDKRWRRSRKIAKVPWGSAHALKVSRPGCEEFAQEVTPAGELELALKPVLSCRPIDEGGTLTLTGPRRGRVVLDGIDVGRLPLQGYKLPVGSYRLEVRGRRDTARHKVQIEQGQNVSMKIRVR